MSAKGTDGNARTKERIVAVVPILEYPHGILRQRAKSVLKIDKTVFRLADDLMDTLVYSGGVGLAREPDRLAQARHRSQDAGG